MTQKIKFGTDGWRGLRRNFVSDSLANSSLMPDI